MLRGRCLENHFAGRAAEEKRQGSLVCLLHREFKLDARE